MNFTKLNIIILIFLFGCDGVSQSKIDITKEYITNKYWDEYNHILLIERMKVKQDSILDIYDSKFDRDKPNHWNIVNKLEVDSSFVYRNRISYNKENETSRTLYFGKQNENDWSVGYFSTENTTKIIGNLENKTWYKFSKLRDRPYFVYVYIDSVGIVHKFSQDLSNY